MYICVSKLQSLRLLMELFLTVINALLSVIMIGILVTWIYFCLYIVRSFKRSPLLESIDVPWFNSPPKVSIIIPARNEENYIAKCLDSLLLQDYPNYEIIALNDSSNDNTGKIIQTYSMRIPKVIGIDLEMKPDGWVGKNWACYQGYLKATGEILLFTDADTVHSPSAMSLAIGHLQQQNLDAITAIPKLLCEDIWIRITLPILSTFLNTRFSALRVNNPKTKTGYFFGSFFAITRSTYEAIGTHKNVRSELIEDGALGGKVKKSKFKMKMVRGEHYVTAVWARDLKSLWNGLRRLIIPLYNQNNLWTSMMVVSVFFLLLSPFLLLPYSLSLLFRGPDHYSVDQILVYSNVMTISVILLSTAIQLRFGLSQNPIYALACPLGSAIISLSFISSILDANKIDAVNWRDRHYTVNQSQHPLN